MFFTARFIIITPAQMLGMQPDEAGLAAACHSREGDHEIDKCADSRHMRRALRQPRRRFYFVMIPRCLQLQHCRCAYELCPYPAHSSGNWKIVQVTFRPSCFCPAAARCVAIVLMMIATLMITTLQPSTCAGGRDWSMFVALLDPCHVFVLFDISQVCWQDVLPRVLDAIQV
jgi:hypothetical protein